MKKLLLATHDWSLAYKIESQFRYIISEQETYGWKIDTHLMERLLREMLEERDNLKAKALALVPFRVLDQGEVAKPLKLDGKISAVTERWYNNLDQRMFSLSAIVGPFSRVSFEPLNLESAQQRIEALEKTGWVPTEYNYKVDKYKKPVYDEDGEKIKVSPKLTDDSVEGNELGTLMVQYTTLSHRYKLVAGLRERLREDMAIGSGGVTCGTNTGRMMHRGIANIPRVSEYYGDEIRALFSHREGHVLIGADLKSLENRLMGHYTFPFDNGAYAKRLEEEDSHETTVNLVRTSIGKEITRSQGKTLNYALGFGCQIGKVAEILDCDVKAAKEVFVAWWDDKGSMKSLKESIERSMKGRGQIYKRRLTEDAWIKGLDGRKIYVRSMHSLINALIQNAGSVVNKFITCSIYKQLKEQNIKAMFVCNYHDEINIEVEEKDLTIKLVEDIIHSSVKKCNDFFKFKVPMEMDIKVGQNWKEIH